MCLALVFSFAKQRCQQGTPGGVEVWPEEKVNLEPREHRRTAGDGSALREFTAPAEDRVQLQAPMLGGSQPR